MGTTVDTVGIEEATGFESEAAEAAIPLGSNAFKVGVRGFDCDVLSDALMEAVLKLNALGLDPVVPEVVFIADPN